MLDFLQQLSLIWNHHRGAALALGTVVIGGAAVLGGAATRAMTERHALTEERMRFVQEEAAARERVLSRQIIVMGRELDILRDAFGSLALDLRASANHLTADSPGALADMAPRLEATASEIERALDRAAETRRLGRELLAEAPPGFSVTDVILAVFVLINLVALLYVGIPTWRRHVAAQRRQSQMLEAWLSEVHRTLAHTYGKVHTIERRLEGREQHREVE